LTPFLSFFLDNRWLCSLLRHHLLEGTDFSIPDTFTFFSNLPSIITDLYTTLRPFFTPTPPSTSVFDQPHHLFSFYFFALTSLQDINNSYFSFTSTHPTTKPPFWAVKLFRLVPITRLATRCVRLTKTNISEGVVPGVTWESIRVPARPGWEATSVNTDGYSASVVYAREGKRHNRFKPG